MQAVAMEGLGQQELNPKTPEVPEEGALRPSCPAFGLLQVLRSESPFLGSSLN